MSKIRTFFIIGIIFLFLTAVFGIMGAFTRYSQLMALSELFVIISMIIKLWGYVVTLENIDRNVTRNVEMMQSLVDAFEKKNRE